MIMTQREFAMKMFKKERKKDLEYTLGSILNLIFHPGIGDDSYTAGWNRSREVIIELCDLEKYRYNEQM